MPRDGRAVFWTTIAPLAPWIFAAPTLSFAVGPSLVGSRVGGMTVAFAAAAAVFGLGYGLTMVSGLGAVQALARPDDLAGVTAVFYALTYVGFLLPAALAAAAGSVDMRILLLAVAVVGIVMAAASSASLRGLGRGR